MKRFTSLWLTGTALILAGCASILVRPGINTVKSVAVVSVYMNREIYNAASPKAAGGAMDLVKSLVKAGLKKTGIDQKLNLEREEQMIISHALKEYNAALASVGRWQVKPVEDLVNKPAYRQLIEGNQTKSFFDAVANDMVNGGWVTPTDFPFFSTDDVAGTRHTKTYGNVKDPKADARKVLADLARALDVDAVAVVQVDAAYRFGKLGRLSLGSTTMAKPTVSSRVVMVTKDGDLAVNTDEINPGAGKRSEGPSVGLVENGRVNLRDDNDKRVNAFNEAISKSAEDMRKTLEKAFSKLK